MTHRLRPNLRVRRSRAGFTSIELLTSVLIVVVLISILIPAVRSVRTAAKQADTRAQIAAIAAACENYYGDFHAYPGPFPNTQIIGGTAITSPQFGALLMRGDASLYPGVGAAQPFLPSGITNITAAENLMLGLLGGLVVEGAPSRLIYDATLLGKGLNSLNPSNPKHSPSYMDKTNLSLRVATGSGLQTGKWGDDGLPLTSETTGGCADTIIPEFVDRYSDPMPILYARASVGSSSAAIPPTDTDNSVVSDAGTTSQYDISQFAPYTASFAAGGVYNTTTNVPGANTSSIGVGKIPPSYVENNVDVGKPSNPYHGLRTVNVSAVATSKVGTAGSYYPLPAFPYLRNPSLSGAVPYSAPNTPHNKDGFILISAGTDRIYGTADDITNFGDVLP